MLCSADQLCHTFCNSMDCSSPGSCALGIVQVRILEWVAISSSRGEGHTKPPSSAQLNYESPALLPSHSCPIPFINPEDPNTNRHPQLLPKICEAGGAEMTPGEPQLLPLITSLNGQLNHHAGHFVLPPFKIRANSLRGWDLLFRGCSVAVQGERKAGGCRKAALAKWYRLPPAPEPLLYPGRPLVATEKPTTRDLDRSEERTEDETTKGVRVLDPAPQLTPTLRGDQTPRNGSA